MTSPLRSSFWEELRRRRVVRAVTVYGVAAWVVVQVADVFFPALRLPEWSLTLVAVLAVLGFPITAAVAWVFERTPEGFQREVEDGDGGAARGPAGGASGPVRVDRRLAGAVVLGALVGVLVVGAGSWLFDLALDGRSSEGPVLAVLPFETVGTASPAFAEGIHGEVLTRLAGVQGLDVISRSSVLAYRGPSRPTRAVARALGATWVLRGEVQQVGSRVRVHARLVDGDTDRQTWADAYEDELTAENLFSIQRDITQQIARALERRLARQPGGEAAAGRRTDDLEAYRLQVQGRSLMGPRTEASLRKAVDAFERAVRRDPGYALAWAGLADALTYLDTFGHPLPEGSVDAGRAAATALELAPTLAEAHFALANLAHADRDNPEAVRRLERAVELRPSYADAHNLLSWIHKLDGRPEAALESAERAVQLDPLGSAPLSNLSLAHLALGDATSALREARRIAELHPDFSTAAFIEGLALHHLGRHREAARRLEGVVVPWASEASAAVQAVSRAAGGDTAGARSAAAAVDATRDPFSRHLVSLATGNAASPAGLVAVKRWDYWPTFAARYLFPALLDELRQGSAGRQLDRRIRDSWGYGR